MPRACPGIGHVRAGILEARDRLRSRRESPTVNNPRVIGATRSAAKARELTRMERQPGS
jgi:hypothetical protein